MPVRRAAGMAGPVARGDLQARLPETSAGEVGELEHAFNAMGGQLAHLLQEQAALRRVATLVARGVRPDEIFSMVAEEIGRLLGADNAGIARFEPDGTSVVVVGSIGEDPVKIPVGTRLELFDYLAPAVAWRRSRAVSTRRSCPKAGSGRPCGRSHAAQGSRSSSMSPR